MSATKMISLDRLSHFLSKMKEWCSANFVSKEAGKGLSSNDYTINEKNKLAGIEAGANLYVLPTANSSTLGGVKQGTNVTIDADGKISVTALEWQNITGRPTKVSDFTNDTGFIINTVDNLTNYYTKTTTYTKSEVDALISTVGRLEIVVVDVLPTASASTMNKIYLVPGSSPVSQNVKDEYITYRTGTEGSYVYTWEKIGSTEIDLSGYWSKTELTEATNAEVDNLFVEEQEVDK